MAENREIVVRAHADATVFGRFPRRNFGMRPRLMVGAYHGGSRAYLTFTVPATDLVIDDATLSCMWPGTRRGSRTSPGRPGWREHRSRSGAPPRAAHSSAASTRAGTARDRARHHEADRRIADHAVVRPRVGRRALGAREQAIRGSAQDQDPRPHRCEQHPHADADDEPDPDADPNPTPSGDVQPSMPIRAAFYYPWFPETWGPSSNPFTNYRLRPGCTTPRTLPRSSNHIDAMQYGGIQAGISSWWGQGSKTDQRVPALLRAADGTGFRWTVYYEPEAQGDPTVAQLQSDLAYLSIALRERSVVPADRRTVRGVRLRRRRRCVRHGLALGAGEHGERLHRA